MRVNKSDRKFFEFMYLKLIEKCGPEVIANFTIYMQEKLIVSDCYDPFKHGTYVELNSEDKKRAIAASDIIKAFYNRIDEHREIRGWGELYLNKLNRISSIEAIENINDLYAHYIRDIFILDEEKMGKLNSDEIISSFFTDHNYMLKEETIVYILLKTHKHLLELVINNEENEIASIENENRKEFENMMRGFDDVNNEDAQDVCPLCHEYPCMCSDPF